MDDTTPPTARHLTRLGRGLHPSKKVRLAPAVNRKRAYYDLTISTTKTVSIAALLRPFHPTARNVLDAHVAAVEKVAEELTRCIFPRNGPAPVRWLGMDFHHTHTREGDPHLHTHLVVPNVAKNAAGDWRAIQIKIGGHLRQRLELRYGHELARQFRRRGLEKEIVMRFNGLPEVRSLLPLVQVFSKAGRAVRVAVEAAGVKIKPASGSPEAGLLSVKGNSGLPVHPQQSEIRFRQKLADGLRKPKAKASDDPALLRDEAERWLQQLTNPRARAYLAFLDECDPDAQRRREIASRAPVVVKADPLPRLRDLILHARRKYLDYLGTNTQPVVFRAVMREVAGRHEWKEIRRAMVVHFAEQREIVRKIKAFNDADSERLEAERIRTANLAAQGIVIVRLPTDPRAIEGARRFPREVPAVPSAQQAAPEPGADTKTPDTAPAPEARPTPGTRGPGR